MALCFDYSIQADRYHGFGVFTSPDGATYSGTWSKHRKHGWGSSVGSGKASTSELAFWDQHLKKEAVQADNAEHQKQAEEAVSQAEAAAEGAKALRCRCMSPPYFISS